LTYSRGEGKSEEKVIISVSFTPVYTQGERGRRKEWNNIDSPEGVGVGDTHRVV
jgi:lipoate-protein ligase B